MRLIPILFIIILIYSFSVMAAAPTLSNYKVDDNDHSINEQINLQPNSTQTVYCSSDVYNTDKISYVTVVSKFYQTSYSVDSQDNAAYHYTNSSCSITSTNPQETEGLINCSFNLEFYALSGAWKCNLSVNNTNTSETSYAIANTTVNELLAIHLNTSSINFGKLAIGKNTGSLDFPIKVENLGNIPIDIAINTFGSSLGDSYSMTCSTGNLQSSDLKYSNQQSIYYSTKTNAVSDLNIGNTITSFDLQQTSSGKLPTTKDLYFGMGISSDEVVSGTCTGNIMLTGVKG